MPITKKTASRSPATVRKKSVTKKTVNTSILRRLFTLKVLLYAGLFAVIGVAFLFSSRAAQPSIMCPIDNTALPYSPQKAQAYGASRSYGPHNGLDFGQNQGGGTYRGAPARAVVNGIMTKVNADSVGTTILRGDDGRDYWYLHMGTYNVKVGQRVGAGQQIGGVGDKGAPGGIHLHFERWEGGRRTNPLVAINGTGGYPRCQKFNGGTPPPTSSSSRNQYYIKTKGASTVEVHRASVTSGYAGTDLHSTTIFSPNDANNGIFQISGPNNDLYYIKTKNTGSGRVEIHAFTAASGFKSPRIQTATAFPLSDAASGTFQMVGTDLYYIKTSTGNGRVEVHAVTSASNYQSFSVHAASAFPLSDVPNGTFQVADNKDLYYIKTARTPGSVEVHAVSAGSNYGSFILHTTSGFPLSDASSGTFQMVGTDLYYIKTKNTAGRIEIHAVGAASRYATFTLHAASAFPNGDATNGRFEIR